MAKTKKSKLNVFCKELWSWLKAEYRKAGIVAIFMLLLAISQCDAPSGNEQKTTNKLLETLIETVENGNSGSGEIREKIDDILEEVGDIYERDLFNEYPLGYVLLFVDHSQASVFAESRLSKNYIVDWDEAKITQIMPQSISLKYPNFYRPDGKPFITSVTHEIPRVEGIKQSFLAFDDISIIAEVLKEKEGGAFIALGFKPVLSE